MIYTKQCVGVENELFSMRSISLDKFYGLIILDISDIFKPITF